MSEGDRDRAPVKVPESLRQATREKGWPDGLLERALEVGIPPVSIEGWLSW